MNHKIRVLLADDSRFFRAIESKFLQKNPIEIVEVDDNRIRTVRVGKRLIDDVGNGD